MLWPEVRKAYPNQWLIVEALEAQTMPGNRRQLIRLAVIEGCPDGNNAFQRYRHLHQEYPAREFYFVHTSREELDIRVRRCLGIRKNFPFEARLSALRRFKWRQGISGVMRAGETSGRLHVMEGGNP